MTLRNNGYRVVYFCHILFLLASNCLCNVKMANSYVFNILYGFSWSFRQSISITRSLYVWYLRFWSLCERTNSRRKPLRVKSWLATFCDSEGIFLGEFLKRGATIHSDLYVRTLKTLKRWIRSFSAKQEDVSNPHSSYSPDLATSVFHLFGTLKVALRERRFADDDELKHSVPEEFWRFSKGFYETGTHRRMQRRKNCVGNEKALWKSNRNFVNDVPMIYVNVIVVVILICEGEKIGGFTFVPPLVRKVCLIYDSWPWRGW